MLLLAGSSAWGFPADDRPPLANQDFRAQPAKPNWIGDRHGFLTGPHSNSEDVVKAFLNANTGKFGHDASALNGAKVKRDFVGRHNGMRTMVWQQEVDGLPVFEGVLVAHTTKRGELVNISSGFAPNPGKFKAGKPLVPAEQAIAVATNDVGVALGVPATHLIWLPVEEATLRLCWEVVLTSRTRGEMFRILVDATTGKLWIRNCLTADYSDVTYRVFTSDSPSPFSPGH